MLNSLKKYDCDNLVFNLEAAITTADAIPLDTGSSCVYGEKNILLPVLDQFGASLSCSLANNHVADYGLTALSDTLNLLKQYDVCYFGAGVNISEALEPSILIQNGVRVGMLSVCSTRKCVGDHLKKLTGGPLSLLDNTVQEQIAILKGRVDHVIVACHWGREFIHYPLPEDRVIAKSLIDEGASLVVGHHPHVLQGYEHYNNGLIIYSLGNFIFPSQTHPQILRWSKTERTSAIAVLDFTKSKLELHSFYPIRLEENNLLILLKGKEYDQIMADVTNWSAAFALPNYKSFYDRKMRGMVFRRIIKGIIRNITHPRRAHIVMIYRYVKQLLMGRKYYVKE